jgi:cytoskeletal protein RodZ
MKTKIISQTNKVSGSLLKVLREKMSVSIDEMSNKIKVSKVYLEAIESDYFDKLPAEVYAKGFFYSYLNYIGLDRKDLVEALMDLYRGQKRLIKKR